MALYCPKCGSDWVVKKGFTTNAGARKQRYLCKDCDHITTNPSRPEESVEMRTTVPTVQRYIVTAAQNATPVHPPLWKSILNCAEYHGAEIVVIPGRYKNPTSQWTEENSCHEWWAPEVLPYLVTGRIRLHERLEILGNVKVQWAAMNPLASMETLTQNRSGIVGHGRMHMKSIATPQHEQPKMMFTTGCVTRPNYTDTKQGEIARFNHCYGALMVEVTEDRFHVRQLSATARGHFCDLDMEFTPENVFKARRPLSLTMGDTHWAKIDPDVYKATFRGIVDTLKPHHIVWHDVLDQYARNHHHRNDYFMTYKKHHLEQDDVRKEVNDTICAIIKETPSDSMSVVVSSNHDRALNRWLREEDINKDPRNKRFHNELEGMVLDYIDETGKIPDAFTLYARCRTGDISNVRFLDPDESFELCGVEHSLHGDLGPNGSRGATRNLSRIGIKVTKGHSHTAEIIDGCYSVGKSTGRLDYEMGPSSHSNTHCLQYHNGKRALITIVNGEWKL